MRGAELAPQPLRPHRLLQRLECRVFAQERVEPRLQSLDPMHEQSQVDPRRPGPSVPRRCARARQQGLQHCVENLGGDRGHRIEIDCAAPLAKEGAHGKVESRCRRRDRGACSASCAGGVRGLRVASCARSMSGHCTCSVLNRFGLPDQCAVRAAATQRIDRRRLARPDPKQTVRFLALCRRVVGVAVQTEQRCDILVGDSIEHPRLPAERGRRVADGRDGVAAVVLAVAERAHAVLPRFAPVDRGETDDHAMLDPRRRAVPARALLERVVTADVVIDPAVEARQVGGDDVAFGRMQVAARGVAAQGPRAAVEGLPGRDRKRELEQYSDRLTSYRRGRRQPAGPHVREADVHLVGGERKGDARGAFVGAEGIGLVCPVEIAGPGRVAAQLMLAALVVVQDRAMFIHGERHALKGRERNVPCADHSTAGSAFSFLRPPHGHTI